MSDGSDWDAPDPPKLLVSAKRIAHELDITVYKATELTWALGRIYYSPAATHMRVQAASFEAFKKLLANGMEWRRAVAVMAKYRADGELPPDDLSEEDVMWIYWRSRQRRRRW